MGMKKNFRSNRGVFVQCAFTQWVREHKKEKQPEKMKG